MKKYAHKPHEQRWRGMIDRCYNSSRSRFKDWGGRGIEVCDEWKDFLIFQNWCFDNFQVNKTLDRIDNDGPYAPWNCKFSTAKEQAQRRRIDTPGCRSRTIARAKGAQQSLHRRYGNPKTRSEKTCPLCKIIKANENFKIAKKQADGRESYCLECRRKYDREYAFQKRHGHLRSSPCICPKYASAV